jgi:DNA-binding HxlR family transcriptional regulator
VEDPGEQSGSTHDREAAKARRDALSAEERERVEQTVMVLLDLLGKAHTMSVLKTFAFADAPLRFSELQTCLGVPPSTLSDRLKELVMADLIHRESYSEVPPRVEYEATEKAQALFPAFGHLYRWAEAHQLDETDATSTRPTGETMRDTQ